MRQQRVGTANFDSTISPRFGKPTGISGADSRFRLISDEYCAVLQRSREELMNIDWTTIIHPDDLADPSTKQEILLATGEPYDVVCRVRRNDGGWVRGHFHVNRINPGPRSAPLVQANGWFEQLPLEQADLKTDRALVEYIQVVAAELAKLADRQGLMLIQHLLSMVSLEAAQELERLYPGLRPWNLPDRLN